MKEINLVGVNFWLEADKRKIDFNVLGVTRNENSKLINEGSQYVMEKALIIIPSLPDIFKYNYLCLKNDQDIIDNFDEANGDEWFERGIWNWKNKAWAIGIHLGTNEDWSTNRIGVGEDAIASYYEVDNRLKDKLYFEIIYKDTDEYRGANAKYITYLDSKIADSNSIREDNSLFFPMNAMHEFMLKYKKRN
ncbi:hypothetical protein [Lactobacillus gasseri]|uniref:Uncharacterized protein n=1 Tax=Lactobacillus gasseri SV-16A-US TaxID=575604 RepID=A0AB34P0Q7_LACGS|nr:hypothetical protein [Lactobacillus gasseri]KFL97499.1 hypothetical protein HMPREF5175_00338 [Lactobacillus gasseri SV-16A-US]MCZ3948413.1 dephospho-CoA kinase [Lactobacillus gasseri]QTH66209.1 dephospho-CoA kinase [Lactobacillus gasseri]RGL13205.1 dephospho-CoA kinase [Lactobacillus gasseri]